mgnify:CR=1 FL=1
MGTSATLRVQLDSIFAPSRVQRSALAPDGRHVAFAVNTGAALEIQIFPIGQPSSPVRVPVENDPRGEIQFLAWVSGDLLVASTRSSLLTSNASGGTLRRINTVFPPAPGIIPDPRALKPSARVMGILPESESILLEFSKPEEPPSDEPPDLSLVNLSVVRLNLRTQETKSLYEKTLLLPGGTVLNDAQGRPRIVFNRGTFPRRFEYFPADNAKSDGKSLDLVLPDREVFAFDVTPANLLGHRTFPLGFGADPNLLYFASNLQRNTYGIYQADLRTGKRTAVILEKDVVDLARLDAPWTQSPLVFDRATQTLAGVRIDGMEAYTHWLDPGLATVQAELDRKFPGRNVSVVEWDDARRHFLFTVSSSTDPGRSFLLDRTDGQCTEYLRHAHLDPDDANASTWFAFDSPAGARLTGYLTLPHASPVKKPGLVIWFHDGPLQRITPGFQREAQALAALGFAVAQINYRGSVGFGVRQFEALPDRIDRHPSDDAIAVIDWLASKYAFDAHRVATFGEGRGGFIALRALQLHPDAFRCAVAINADLNPARLPMTELEKKYFSYNATDAAKDSAARVERSTGATGVDFSMVEPGEFELSFGPRPGETKNYTLEAGSALKFSREFARLTAATAEKRSVGVDAHPELLTQPVFFLHDPGNLAAPIAPVRMLRETLRRRKTAPEYFELSPLYAQGDPAIRANAFLRIARFINASFYDYDVKIGEMTEKK